MTPKLQILALMLVLSLPSWAQQYKTGRQVIEDVVEKIASTTDEDLDYSEIAEDLEYYIEFPLNLNTATTDELEKLLMLNDFQIKSLLSYINKKGPMLTIYELQLIEGFTYPLIKSLLPFVNVQVDKKTESWNIKKGIKYGKNEIFFRTTSTLENPVGYENVSDSVRNEKPNNYYPGNKHRIYTKYKFNYKKKLQWGITAEKDPGEQFLAGEQKYGFDFYSAHLQIDDIGIFKTTVLGDYQVQLGQGLIMWSYLSNSKSAYVMDIRKKGQGLRKYSSTDENAYLRGAGTTLNFKNLYFTVFGSHKEFDATLSGNDTLSNEDIYFSSADISGIHATTSQIAKKDAITETLAGSNLAWHAKKFKLGISGVAYQYDIPLQKDTKIYNQFDFQGAENFNLSADFQYMFKGIHFFGEAAVSKNGGTAILTGALMELAPQLSGVVLYRNYSIDYQTAYGNAFAEGSRVQNEKGFYLGVEMHPVKKFKIAAYYDFFKFPWLKQQASAPSSGNDYLIQVDFVPARTLSMYARLKQEIKQENGEFDEIGIAELTDTDKLSARYHINYSVSNKWKFRNRIEISRYSDDRKEYEYGYLIFQDIVCSPFKFPLAFSLRYAIFETESYDSRIYTYESDVLYAYSVPALYDKGTRAYLLCRYKLHSNLDLWIRYSQTWYANKKSIGSGLNEIPGNTKSEIKFQLRWKI